MSKLSDKLTARREAMGMEVKDVVAELNRRGLDLAYSTVAGWLNGSRAVRWKVEELKALLDVLGTDLESITDDEVQVVEGAERIAIAREAAELTPMQQQAVLALIRSMKPQ
jgi:transcriptional regulator with XRE-family HTH domain